MNETQRQDAIFTLSHQLAEAEAARDKAQRELCAALSSISTIRAKMRDCGYMHPQASSVA